MRRGVPECAGGAAQLSRSARNGAAPSRVRAREIEDLPDTRIEMSGDIHRRPSTRQRRTSRTASRGYTRAITLTLRWSERRIPPVNAAALHAIAETSTGCDAPAIVARKFLGATVLRLTGGIGWYGNLAKILGKLGLQFPMCQSEGDRGLEKSGL